MKKKIKNNIHFLLIHICYMHIFYRMIYTRMSFNDLDIPQHMYARIDHSLLRAPNYFSVS